MEDIDQLERSIHTMTPESITIATTADHIDVSPALNDPMGSKKSDLHFEFGVDCVAPRIFAHCWFESRVVKSKD